MQGLSGVLLMLAGIGLAAYTYLPAPPDNEQTLSEVTRISLTGTPERPTADVSAAPSLRPASASRIAASQVSAAERAYAALANRSRTTWTAVVNSDPTSSTTLRSSKPGDAMTRYELARDLQRELKRAGCYGGEITGSWSPSTKRAMAAFIDRVNATLPFDEPDFILLTLIQSHSGAACGGACRTGEAMSENGRCVPRAVVAQAQRRQQRDIAKAASFQSSPKVAVFDPNARGLKRIDAPTLAGKRPAAEMRIAAADIKAPPQMGVVRVGPKPGATARETLPWLNEQATTAAERERPALPGRMAVGAPLPPLPEIATGKSAAIGAAEVTPALPLVIKTVQKKKSAKIARKLSNGPNTKRYASASYSAYKSRRGAPRPGTPRFNLLQSLGGIY